MCDKSQTTKSFPEVTSPLGNIDQLIVLMRDAFQEALLCTNDPECLNNTPAGNNSNGAACHSCCMISETACENGNRMLDRGLVVPINGRLTFEDFQYIATRRERIPNESNCP